jgi:hypothetical protein
VYLYFLYKLTQLSPMEYMQIRQSPNELDSSSSTESSNPVMLSAAKHLVAHRHRPLVAFLLSAANILRLTLHDRSNWQGPCFKIEPGLNTFIRSSVGADLSRTSPIYLPSLAYSSIPPNLLKFFFSKPNSLPSINKHSSECLYKPRSQNGI